MRVTLFNGRWISYVGWAVIAFYPPAAGQPHIAGENAIRCECFIFEKFRRESCRHIDKASILA